MKTVPPQNLSDILHRKIPPLSVKLDGDEKTALMKIAKQQKRSVHFVMRQALSEYIDREQKRVAFYETAKKSGEHYRQTGLHTTHEEMKAWAESLGMPNELPSPVCHK